MGPVNQQLEALMLALERAAYDDMESEVDEARRNLRTYVAGLTAAPFATGGIASAEPAYKVCERLPMSEAILWNHNPSAVIVTGRVPSDAEPGSIISVPVEQTRIPTTRSSITEAEYAGMPDAVKEQLQLAHNEALQRGMSFLVCGRHVSPDDVVIVGDPHAGLIAEMRKHAADARAVLAEIREAHRPPALSAAAAETVRRLCLEVQYEHEELSAHGLFEQLTGIHLVAIKTLQENREAMRRFDSLREVHRMLVDSYKRIKEAVGVGKAESNDITQLYRLTEARVNEIVKGTRSAVTLKFDTTEVQAMIAKAREELLAELGPSHFTGSEIGEFRQTIEALAKALLNEAVHAPGLVKRAEICLKRLEAAQ